MAPFWPGGDSGAAVILHGGGAPAGGDNVRITPLPFFNGHHVCVSDWHVVNIFLIDGGDSTFTREQAVADFSPLVFHYTLDGNAVDSMVTPIKRATNPRFGFDVAYWESGGLILAPDALSVGTHVVRLVIDNFLGPGMPGDSGDITFYVDAAGTGACL